MLCMCDVFVCVPLGVYVATGSTQQLDDFTDSLSGMCGSTRLCAYPGGCGFAQAQAACCAVLLIAER